MKLIQSQKIKSKLRPLLWLRILETGLHIYVLGLLGVFLAKNFGEALYLIPALSLILFFGMAFANCIKQLILFSEMNYTEDVLTIQSKLIKSQTITIDYVKLAFLAIPTYLAYPIIGFKALGGIDITQLNIKWWMANMIFSLLITPICIWIYRQVSFKNIEKRWVRFIIDHTAGTSVTKALEFAREIQDIKKAN